jgi:hypothetical protein
MKSVSERPKNREKASEIEDNNQKVTEEEHPLFQVKRDTRYNDSIIYQSR